MIEVGVHGIAKTPWVDGVGLVGGWYLKMCIAFSWLFPSLDVLNMAIKPSLLLLGMKAGVPPKTSLFFVGLEGCPRQACLHLSR